MQLASLYVRVYQIALSFNTFNKQIQDIYTIHLTHLQDIMTQLVLVVYSYQFWLHQQQCPEDHSHDMNSLAMEPHQRQLLLQHSWAGLPPTWMLALRDLYIKDATLIF